MSKKYSLEEVREIVESYGCKLISDTYTSNNSPIIISCKDCNEEFTTSLSTVKGKGKHLCDKCSTKLRAERKSISREEIIKIVDIATNNEFNFIEFVRYDTDTRKCKKLRITHEKCGKTFDRPVTDWRKNNTCPYCNKIRISEESRLPFETWLNRVEADNSKKHALELIGIDYKFSETENKNVTYLELKHVGCGHVFKRTQSNYYTNNRCPKCSSMANVSYLHAVMSVMFEEYYENVEFEYDIGFKGARGGKSRYDLYVPDLNGRKTIFEFQSRYHDEKIKHDDQKFKYAKDKGYDVITIDHRDCEIRDAIKRYFPDVSEIPEWVSDELKRFNKLDIVTAQSLINQYMTYDEVANAMNVPKTTIMNAVGDDRIIIPCDYREKALNIRPVVQIDLEGNFVAEYRCGNATGLNLSSVLSGASHHKDGFIWMYKSEYEKIEDKSVFSRSLFRECSSPIVQLSIDGEIIRSWNDISEIKKCCDYNDKYVREVLRGKRTVACGYRWMFKADYENGEYLFDISKYALKNRKVVQLDLNNCPINTFDSVGMAEKTMGVTNVSRAIAQRLTAGGFKWIYHDDFIKL